VPPNGTSRVPTYGTNKVPPRGTPNQKSSSEISIENPPPPPTGGNGRPDEVGRPRYTLSEKTIRDLIAARGKTEIIEMLKQGNYPIPAFLLTDTKDDLADIPKEALE